MVNYKLTYFDGRGVAETARQHDQKSVLACNGTEKPISRVTHTKGVEKRQIFALADQKFEDNRLTREAFAEVKPTLPFGQVPVLEVDGKQLAQSLAINRYLAKKFGENHQEIFEFFGAF
ncbi:unnamed protein product [Haemonchus placei]|uniref:glutathione transferase n=1 Tax=Haemonchus placei TaxID=6290 RepID=A0A0N4X2M8_HAEPC|nr:unnamed protein product [Haemonchus placei]